MAVAHATAHTFRCLVIDDLEIHCKGIRQVVKSALNRLGFPAEIDCAFNEEEALALCSQNGYHLIVADKHMKPKNGAEITQEILKRHPDALFVGCSTLEDQKDVDECRRAGMQEVLPKDWTKVRQFILDHFQGLFLSWKSSSAS